MPNLQDFQEQLIKLRAELESRLPNIAGVVALSAKALAERNIKETGFGKVYSQNFIPSWFLTGKELNQRGPDYVKAKRKTKEGVNWQGFRQAQGLQTGHVDLTYTGKMWAGMGVVKVERQGDIVRAFLGGNNSQVTIEMNYNRDRYGDFIGVAITPANLVTLQEVVRDEIDDVVKQFLPQ